MDLISVIVPVYNVEKYLPKCLDSIINQTYNNLEIILINDGSTDNSGKICDEYATRDSRVKVIHKVNGGLSDARNAGLDICTGDYIGFVDSDDYIALDMYYVMYNYLIANNLDVAMCSSADVVDGMVSNVKYFNAFVVNTKSEVIESVFINKLGSLSFSVCNKLFKRVVIKDVRFTLKKAYEDVFFAMDWILNTTRYGRIPDCKYFYVQRAGSITNQKYYKESILDVIEAYERNLCIVKQTYPEATKCAEYRVFWGYREALENLFLCEDFKEHIQVVGLVQKKLRHNILKVVKNPYCELKDIVACLLASVNLDLYMFVKARCS